MRRFKFWLPFLGVFGRCEVCGSWGFGLERYDGGELGEPYDQKYWTCD